MNWVKLTQQNNRVTWVNMDNMVYMWPGANNGTCMKEAGGIDQCFMESPEQILLLARSTERRISYEAS